MRFLIAASLASSVAGVGLSVLADSNNLLCFQCRYIRVLREKSGFGVRGEYMTNPGELTD